MSIIWSNFHIFTTTMEHDSITNLSHVAYILANVNYLDEASRLLFLSNDTYHDERLLIPFMHYGYGNEQTKPHRRRLRTLLQAACRFRNLPRVKECIRYRADPDLLLNTDEPSALVWAIWEGYSDIVAYLVNDYYAPQFRRYYTNIKTKKLPIRNTASSLLLPNESVKDAVCSSSSSSSSAPSYTAMFPHPPPTYRILADTRPRSILFSSLSRIHFDISPSSSSSFNLPLSMQYIRKVGAPLHRTVTLAHSDAFCALLFASVSSLSFSVFWQSEIRLRWKTDLLIALMLCKEEDKIYPVRKPSNTLINTTTTGGNSIETTTAPSFPSLDNASSEVLSTDLLSFQIGYLRHQPYHNNLLLPIQASIVTNNLPLFKYLHSLGEIAADSVFFRLGEVLASYGNLEFFRYLRSQDNLMCCVLNETLCSQTARNGHLSFIQYLREQDPPCPWDSNTCDMASFFGNLELLQWLRDRMPLSLWTTSSYYYAATAGHLPVIEWLYTLKPRIPIDSSISYAAARSNHVHILEWLRKRTPPFQWNEQIFSSLALNGHLDYLQWLKCDQYPEQFTSRLCNAAVMGGRLDVLQWLRSLNPPCPWDEQTCAYAAEYDHLPILRWLRQEGCPWDEETCNAAARTNNMEILHWLMTQNPPVPFDEGTMSETVKQGHRNIVKYLHEHGCPWDTKACRNAAKYGHVQLLQYLYDNGCPWDDQVCLRFKRYLLQTRSYLSPTTEEENTDDKEAEKKFDTHYRLQDYVQCKECPCNGKVCRK